MATTVIFSSRLIRFSSRLIISGPNNHLQQQTYHIIPQPNIISLYVTNTTTTMATTAICDHHTELQPNPTPPSYPLSGHHSHPFPPPNPHFSLYIHPILHHHQNSHPQTLKICETEGVGVR
ncbi:hypothetical protein Hanom_Chr16g01418871 [Helianthus anomalus]